MKYSVLVGRIVSIITTFFLNWLAARLLPQAETGQYFLSISWVWLASLLIQFGSNYSLNRWIPIAIENNDRSLLSSRLKSTLLTSLGLYLFLCMLLSLIAHWFDHELGFGFVLFLVWIGLASIQITIAEIFRSFSIFSLATLMSGPLAQFITLTLGFIFFFQKKILNIETLVILTIIGLFVSSVYGAIRLYPQVKKFWSPTRINWKGKWSGHFDFFLVNIFLYTFSQIDIWMVSALSEKNIVAQYSVGQRIALLASVPASVVNLSLMPDFSRWLAKSENEKIQKALRMSSLLGGIPALLIVVIIFFGGKFLIQFAFGLNYADSAQIALILSIGQAFHYLSGSQGVLLLMAGKQRSLMNAVFFSTCVSIALQIGFFHLYGPSGIAFGSSIGLVVQTLYFLRVSSRDLGVSLIWKRS